MLGGLYLHVKGRGGTRGQTVWGIPELQTTRGMRGTKELKDTDICILKDQAWRSGALVPPWLHDL